VLRFGGGELLMEVVQVIDVPTFDKAWIEVSLPSISISASVISIARRDFFDRSH
jgi:hypothetical protein